MPVNFSWTVGSQGVHKCKLLSLKWTLLIITAAGNCSFKCGFTVLSKIIVYLSYVSIKPNLQI